MDQQPGRPRMVTPGPFGKPDRLTRPDEFRVTLAAECRLVGKNFLVRALPNNRAAARLGLIASRKAASRAVDRNRGKRLAREAFRAARGELPAVDIVFQLRNNLRMMGNPLIREELNRLLREVTARFGRDDGAQSVPSRSTPIA